MKTLILIFFIPLIMIGQDSTLTTGIWNSTTLRTKTPAYIKSRNIWSMDYGFFIIDTLRKFDGTFKEYISLMLLESLDEYEAECYVDSTKSWQFIKLPPDSTFPFSRYKEKKILVHREPTFKGFIKFLRSKR